MRCGCQRCGAYMAQSEGLELGCVCPECGYRCKLCLGTNTVIDREALRARAAEYMKNAESDPDNTDWEDDTP